MFANSQPSDLNFQTFFWLAFFNNFFFTVGQNNFRNKIRGAQNTNLISFSTYQHWCHSDISLLPSSHSSPSLICLIDCSDYQDIKNDHNNAWNDTHEYEIGQEYVVLDVFNVGAKFGLFHYQKSFVDKKDITRCAVYQI